MFEEGYILSDGRYEMKEKIGEGGMGLVQRAFDRILEIDVALKFQKPGASSLARKLFMVEAKAMARLTGHSNVVSIFNIGVCFKNQEPVNYIAFEYLEGGNATKLIGKSDILQCLKLGIEVAKGLQVAHQHNILHRDIKPSNILLGRNNTIKVSDFGLAQILSDESEATPLHGNGTPSYMAPEQFNHSGIIDERTDIYQLGTTLYYILTGQLPRQNNFRYPQEINRNIPESICELLMEMLNDNPNERPQNLNEIMLVLETEVYSIKPNKTFVAKEYIIHGEPFVNIRRALKEKVEKVVDFFASSEDSVVVPRPDEKQIWYATVLLRPFQSDGRGGKKLANKFHPIYFANYESRQLISISDWEKDYQLLQSFLDIRQCCSGLPILWYSERDKWTNGNNQNLWFCKATDRFINFFVLRNIHWARFESSTENIIKSTYATDKTRDEWSRGVGWELTNKYGEDKPMTQLIETEILVPIYNPFFYEKFGKESAILGVANFEWEQRLSPERETEIGEYLYHYIREQNQFAMGEFTCEVLNNIVIVEDSKL